MYIDMLFVMVCFIFFFFKQKTAYEMRISDWSSDVCSSDLLPLLHHGDLVVNVGAGADPAHDRPMFVPDRQGAAQCPAIIAAMMAQPIFDLIGFAGFQRMAPAPPGAFLIVRMEHAVPSQIGRAHV